MLVDGHVEPTLELSGLYFFFKSLVLLSIQLLTKAVGNIMVVLEHSALFDVFDERL